MNPFNNDNNNDNNSDNDKNKDKDKDDNNNNTSFTRIIINFDKSTLKPIENKEKGNESENEDDTKNHNSNGRRKKQCVNMDDQLQELNRFMEEYKEKYFKNIYGDKQEYIIKKYKCGDCDFSTDRENDYQEHIIKHLNEKENDVCACIKCGQIFENNEYYLLHKSHCKKNTIG